MSHLVDTKTCKLDKRRCISCPPFQLSCHPDGDHKLIKRRRLDGSARTLGEEQEQVFSTCSSYSNSTKTMGGASMV